MKRLIEKFWRWIMDISKDVWMGRVQEEVAERLNGFVSSGMINSYTGDATIDTSIRYHFASGEGSTITVPDANRDGTVVSVICGFDNAVGATVNATFVSFDTSAALGEKEAIEIMWLGSYWQVISTSGIISYS